MYIELFCLCVPSSTILDYYNSSKNSTNSRYVEHFISAAEIADLVKMVLESELKRRRRAEVALAHERRLYEGASMHLLNEREKNKVKAEEVSRCLWKSGVA